jgi:hypothetical protein
VRVWVAASLQVQRVCCRTCRLTNTVVAPLHQAHVVLVPSGAAVHTYFRHAVKKAAGVAVVAHILARFSLPHVPRVILQGLSQYLALSLSMDLLAACVGAGTGLAVAPHFDNPYLSTSRENALLAQLGASSRLICLQPQHWHPTIVAGLPPLEYHPASAGNSRLTRARLAAACLPLCP